MKLNRDLREFIGSLNSAHVDYVIVGAHALAYHGHPRFTGDLDIAVRPTKENATRVIEALRAFGFGDSGLTAADFTGAQQVVQLGLPPNRIDLLSSLTGVDFETLWANRLSAQIDGLAVNMMARQQLLDNKRALGRAKDLADIESLTRE